MKKIFLPLMVVFFAACGETEEVTPSEQVKSEFKFSGPQFNCGELSFSDSLKSYVNAKFHFELQLPKSFEVNEYHRPVKGSVDSSFSLFASGAVDSTFQGMMPGFGIRVERNLFPVEAALKAAEEKYGVFSQVKILEKGKYKDFHWLLCESKVKEINEFNPERIFRIIQLFNKPNSTTLCTISISEMSGVGKMGICELLPLIETLKWEKKIVQ
ncbi:MAG: hypothetical protein ACKOXB_15745 [Flavobacteriales bacterium]